MNLSSNISIIPHFDNRITERMPWLPWAAIIFTAVVILILFIFALKHKKDN
jgi:hypothetical protein